MGRLKTGRKTTENRQKLPKTVRKTTETGTNFYKKRAGGGSKAFYKNYKKTDVLVHDDVPKDTRSSLQSPLSKTKPNHISETIVSNTAIFSDSAKPNILSLWTFEKYVELWKTPILDHVGLLKWYNSQTQTCEKAAVLFEMSSVNNFYNIVFFNWVIFDCLSTICSKGTVFGLHPKTR